MKQNAKNVLMKREKSARRDDLLSSTLLLSALNTVVPGEHGGGWSSDSHFAVLRGSREQGDT